MLKGLSLETEEEPSRPELRAPMMEVCEEPCP